MSHDLQSQVILEKHKQILDNKSSSINVINAYLCYNRKTFYDLQINITLKLCVELCVVISSFHVLV